MSNNCSPQNRVLGQEAVAGSRSVQKVIRGMKSEQSTWGSLGCEERHWEDHGVHRTAFGSQTHKARDMKGKRWTHYSVIPSCPPLLSTSCPPHPPYFSEFCNIWPVEMKPGCDAGVQSVRAMLAIAHKPCVIWYQPKMSLQQHLIW